MKKLLLILTILFLASGCVYLKSNCDNLNAALIDGEGFLLVDGESLADGYADWNEFCDR